MNTVQKLSLSLLLAVVLFSAFALFAFSGLFSYIESSFYDQKVRQDIDLSLSKTAGFVDRFHDVNLQKYEAILKEESVRTVFLLNQSREDIFKRVNAFGKLLEETPQLHLVRFVDLDLKKIHFSTLESDLKARTQTAVEYKQFKDVEGSEFIADLEKIAADKRLFYNGAADSFVYAFKVFDLYNSHAGYGFFYVTKKGLSSYLVQNKALDLGEELDFIGSGGLLLRANLVRSVEIRRSVLSYWNNETREPPIFSNEDGSRYVLFEKTLNDESRVGVFIAQDRFFLHPIMKGILLASVFLSAFLLIFLLLNIRQDASLILSERVKKFQITLLKEYLDRKEEIDWRKWQSELEIRREDVKKEIKRGIGKLGKDQKEKLDLMVDKSWDEIINVLGKKAAEKAPAADLERIEGIVEKVVANLQLLEKGSFSGGDIKFGRSGKNVAAVPLPKIEASTKPALSGDDAEAVEEFEEAEAVEEVDTPEKAAAAEEVETLEEAETAEEVETLEEAEAVDEVETLEEAEAVEEIETLEEAEAVEEVESLEESERVEDAKTALKPPAAAEAVPKKPAVPAQAPKAPAKVQPVEAPKAPAKVAPAQAPTIPAKTQAATQIPTAAGTPLKKPAAAAVASPKKTAAPAQAPKTPAMVTPALQAQKTPEKVPPAQAPQALVKVQPASLPAGLQGLNRIIEAGKFLLLSLETRKTQPPESLIVQRADGTVQIDDHAFNKGQGSKTEFQSLVNQVTQDSAGSERTALGIDDLFGDFGLDLHQILSEKEGKASASPADLSVPAFGSCLTEDGFFQYDNFLNTFRKTETGITKSLMSVSRIFSSFFCAILLPREGNFRMLHFIGLKEKPAHEFKLPLTTQLQNGIALTGKAVIVDWPILQIKEFSEIIPQIELADSISLMLIPTYFLGEKGYLALCVNKRPSIDTLKVLLGSLGRAKH